MRLVRSLFSLILVLALLTPAFAQEAEAPRAYFSITSERTYVPGEKIGIGVYSNNVATLEFRVYRVNDPAKFFGQLQDMHSFGGQAPRLPKQQGKTWLERFHAWKHRVWAWIRDVFRAQFSEDSRHKIRGWQEGEPEPQKKTGPQTTDFAQIPLLNQQQLVTKWKWVVPPGERWQSKRVEVPVTEKGVYLVEATNGALRAYTIVVVTDLAIITKAAPGRLVCYVVNRNTGEPVSGANTRVWIEQQDIANKAADGQGILDVAITEAKPENVAVLASSGGDVTVNAPGAWNLGSESRSLRGYTYTDRPVYRPGDTVHFKAIVRSETPTGYVIPADKELSLELRDPRTYEVIWQQNVTLSDIGTAHWDYAIPADGNLGFYYLNIKSGERYVEGVRFSVEDYKKPEYSVKVTAQTPRVLQGQPIKATIDARYYFGEPVANAKVKWVVHTSTYWPYPAYESDSDAGDDEYEADDDRGDSDSYGGDQESEQSGVLDADGKLQITIPTKVSSKKHDSIYRIEARVTDAGNREISGHGFAIATYGNFFVDASPASYVFTMGSTAVINVIAQDYDKKPIATAFHAELAQWNWRKHEGPTVSISQGQTDAQGKGQVQFVIPEAGEYRIRVTAQAGQGREVESSTFIWASGGSFRWGMDQQERIKMVADKPTYAPGDTAHVVILTGDAPVSVLVTTEGNGLYSQQVVKGSGGSITVDVPVKPEYAPNFFVAAAFIRGNKFYSGSKSLKVPPTQHEMKVALQPSKTQYQPGEAASYIIKATDASGKPVAGADFSLGVVDEAIYAIQPESAGNILTTFYGNVYSKVATDSSLSYYFTGQAGDRAMQLASLNSESASLSRTALAALKPERLVQPKIRKAFPDTAFWVADVNTDANGQATVKFNYPDAITSWRATTRGVAQNTMVGSAVENAIVRKNLMVRLVVPRFFRRGDEIVVSTIVQNYLPAEKTAQVSMEFTGLQVLDGATKNVPVPSRGTVKVDYRVRVLDVDSAKVLGKALTDVESDAMELTLPVEPFGVKLAVPKSGSIAGNNSVSEQIAFSQGIERNTRKLTIELAPSIAGTVLGALDFLTSYPYGCTEQTMSSFLPDVLVADAVKKLGVSGGVDPQKLNKQVQAGLDKLYQYQHPDGGWGWWQTDDSQPFMTAYVLAGLVQAKSAGYTIEDERITNARKWLLPQFMRSTAVKTDLRAYMAYVLVLSGSDSNAAVLDSVWNRRSTLTAYGKALLGLAMAQTNDLRASELASDLVGSAKQDDSQAWWPTDNNYLMDFYGDTTPEATAYALKLLDRVEPQSPLLPKAAMWLVMHRSSGYYWDSTEQTAMVIYGLTDYLQRTQELKPNYSVEVQVNGKTVGTKKFTAADAMAPPMSITLQESQLSATGNQVKLVKSGEGRLYWSARGEYYTSQANAVNTGTFQLSTVREYYRLTPQQTDDNVVYHLDKISGPLQVGDTLAVRITVGGSNWRYLMVEDPIPSGTESIARDDLYQLDQQPPWWQSRWSSYRELRDDRTTFFNYWFSRGQSEYTYLLKVVNPGVFRVSPTRVEPMYQPQYMSTSSAMTVTVK
jgi:uncharacterized protein YfaS (alpha-2-macroglobulin family)